jgi:hypothetical protein
VKVAEHGQTCTRDRTSDVPVRAALESFVQVGRGDEVKRQAEMANSRMFDPDAAMLRICGNMYVYCV